MWYITKAVIFFNMTLGSIFLTLTGDLPFQLGMILSVGMFSCLGLTVAQLFCEDL